MEPRIEKTLLALRANRFEATWQETAATAADYLTDTLKGAQSIGFGDSETLISMKMYERLKSLGLTVFDPKHPAADKTFYQTGIECLTTEVFLTSANAISETGELVNIDGTGNRVAGSLFGHKKVYFVVGINKLAPTLEAAIFRARNVAAPKNSARHCSKTPCALAGDKCYDCSSPQRICNAMTIYFKKMHSMRTEVILIGEELGL